MLSNAFLYPAIAAIALAAPTFLGSCAKGASSGASTADSLSEDSGKGYAAAPFSGDSAYIYVEKQVDFGPRVPNTTAHADAGKWLESELKRHGAKVAVQSAALKAFDGTILNTKNIFGQYNPEADERILLLAHWDCRPWADADADPAKRQFPVDGANDGASGVGVLLEVARQLSLQAPKNGVDILFVDAEDWGTEGNEDSWALGTAHFVKNPIIPGYKPKQAILLDMVGGTNARFRREYFSQNAAPGLNEVIWQIAANIGYGQLFENRLGGAITDDHIQLINAGIPTIDIIEYNDGGFNERWHTTSDNMEGISKETLTAVGETIMTYLRNN